jgi:hypothetical protein
MSVHAASPKNWPSKIPTTFALFRYDNDLDPAMEYKDCHVPGRRRPDPCEIQVWFSLPTLARNALGSNSLIGTVRHYIELVPQPYHSGQETETKMPATRF